MNSLSPRCVMHRGLFCWHLWRDIANTYFDRSASWLYHKLDGIDGNGGVGGFTDKEKVQLRGALVDLSDRLRRAADNI